MTGYMAEMRKLVGHRTIIQCAASIICIDGQGRVLLGKRRDNHKWGYSGGSVEIDEYVEDCAKRELYEEMGLTAEKIEFFFVNSGPEAHYIYPNGEPTALDGEMEELKFFVPDEIDISEISPPIRSVITALIKKIS